MPTEKQRQKLRDLLKKRGPELTLTVKQLKARLGIFSTKTLEELLIEVYRTGEVHSEMLEESDGEEV